VIQTLIWTPLHTFGPNQILQDSQITCFLKFKYNKYMGNALKQLFFGPVSYPHIISSIFPSLDPDTWKYVLLSCIQPHLHALQVKRHNKTVWQLQKLIT
jgi:hypothetical protein